MSYKDHFSNQSDFYVKYRPTYPDVLFEVILNQVNEKKMAWDCGTGNGQAAKALASHFTKLIATDASAKQIEKATPIPNVEFLVNPAEKTPFETDSFDLITVAQAAHWFDLSAFYEEVKRVIKPGGILAMWTYQLFETEKHIQEIVEKFYFDIIFNYWPPERRLVESGYRDLYFPFEQIEIPSVAMYLDWNYEQMIGYLNSWSAVKNYKQKHNENPVELIAEELFKKWGNPSKSYRMTWSLPMLMTRF